MCDFFSRIFVLFFFFKKKDNNNKKLTSIEKKKSLFHSRYELDKFFAKFLFCSFLKKNKNCFGDSNRIRSEHSIQTNKKIISKLHTFISTEKQAQKEHITKMVQVNGLTIEFPIHIYNTLPFFFLVEMLLHFFCWSARGD